MNRISIALAMALVAVSFAFGSVLTQAEPPLPLHGDKPAFQAAPVDALAEAKADFKGRADAKRKLIDKLRPPVAEYREAVAALEGVSADESRVLTALRFLAPQRNAELPRFEKDLVVPPLGTLKADKDEVADAWVYLRLMALARAGYPCTDAMLGEMEALLGSATPYVTPTAGWSDVSLELLTLAALSDWASAEPIRESINARAKLVCSQISFEVAQPTAIDANAINFLANAALARHLARTRGWKEGLSIESWKGVCQQILKFAKKLDKREMNLWGGREPERNAAERNRVCLLLGLFLNLACAEPELSMTKADLKNALAGARARVAPAATDKNAWRVFYGDSLALALGTSELCDAIAQAEVSKAATTFALGKARNVDACPRPDNSHIAAALGWVLVPASASTGMGRSALTLDSRDLAASLCLALCAMQGGLLGATNTAPKIDAEKAAARMRALETLEICNHLDYIGKVDDAIDRAALYLCTLQKDDGTFAPYNPDPNREPKVDTYGGTYAGGGNAISALTLLDAEASRDLIVIKRVMEWLRRNPPRAASTLANGTQGQWYNYCVGLYLMAFQKFYEPEQRDAGVFSARTPEEFSAAREKAWQAISAADRKLLGAMAWAVSDSDGYGWGYHYPDIGSPAAATPEPKRGPITGKGRQDSNDGRNPTEFPARPQAPRPEHTHSDSSNTQYAVLGLKAALLLGAPVKFQALAWEGQRLIENFIPVGNAERVVGPLAIKQVLTDKAAVPASKSSKYVSDDPDERRLRAKLQRYDIGGWSYFAGKGATTWGDSTNRVKSKAAQGQDDDEDADYKGAWVRSVAMSAAGLSSLAIVREAMLMANTGDRAFLERLDSCMDGALYYLGKIYPYSKEGLELDPTISQCWIGGGEGRGMCYDIYSVERAGVLSGVKFLANVDWYREGADFLMSKQGENGNWPALVTAELKDGRTGKVIRPASPQTINMCFVTLFLKRATPPMLKEPAKKTNAPVITGDKKEK